MDREDIIRRSDAIKAMAKAVGRILYDAEAVSQHVMNSVPAVESTVDKDYLISLIQEAVYDGEACKRLIDMVEQKDEEKWADVIGFEGLYQVSDQARVRNRKGEIMKQGIKVGGSTCYKTVKLYKDGQYKGKYVHRIMAECFIPNPDNLPVINHKDEDGTNNRLDNLEWCTVKYNSNYGNAPQRSCKKKKGVPLSEEHKAKVSESLIKSCREGNGITRAIICLNNQKIYNCINDASRELGINKGTLWSVCKRGSTTKDGLKFMFYDEYCGADMRKGADE